jgi:ketosteroid isomerase-like protein
MAVTTAIDVDALDKAFAEAVARPDADALADCYGVDAKLFPPNRPMVAGKEAIRGFWQQMFDLGLRTAEVQIVAHEEGGGHVVADGSYQLRNETPNGDVTNIRPFMVVWKRLGEGSTNLVLDTFPSDLPAQTA